MILKDTFPRVFLKQISILAVGLFGDINMIVPIIAEKAVPNQL